MDFGSTKSTSKEDCSDYVNYAPAPKTAPLAKEEEEEPSYAMMSPEKTSTAMMIDEGDYAMMHPGMMSLVVKMQNVKLQGGDNSFRPIMESKEDISSPKSRDDGNYYDMIASNVKSARPKSVNCDRVTASVTFDLSRPASVSSDNTRGVSSRPSSASSELCSSSSTLVGSRPESVNSDRVRPSDGLHYASLDLSAATDEDGMRSPRNLKNQNSQEANQPGYTYADIAFGNEGLKANAVQNKVKN